MVLIETQIQIHPRTSASIANHGVCTCMCLNLLLLLHLELELRTGNLQLGTWDLGIWCILRILCVLVFVCCGLEWCVCARVCVCDVPVCEVRSAKCKEVEVVFCDCDS